MSYCCSIHSIRKFAVKIFKSISKNGSKYAEIVNIFFRNFDIFFLIQNWKSAFYSSKNFVDIFQFFLIIEKKNYHVKLYQISISLFQSYKNFNILRKFIILYGAALIAVLGRPVLDSYYDIWKRASTQ